MRVVGRISGWNDEKGFGFVVPHDGGPRAFVHIKAFQRGSRRPADGDLISYDSAKDAKGRINASSIRFAGQKIAEPKPHRSVPRIPIALVFMALVVFCVATARAPFFLLAAYVVMSVISYMAYCWDKAAAEKGARRTPEASLHLMDLLCGWPGGLLAQHRFRHKTIKPSFQSSFWLTVFVNVVAVVLVVDGRILQIAKDMSGG
jgi:uncharacterized membrane protein YsdA (DUF1294 family)/cold shock CspA family protein